MLQHIEKFTNPRTNTSVLAANDGDMKTWFELKSVCDALGIVNHKGVAQRLHKDHKKKLRLEGGTDRVPPGGSQEKWYINEPGLYAVIFKSNKPEAIKFQKWITDEVIPTIRKTGSYNLVKADLIKKQNIERCLLPAPEKWNGQFPRWFYEEVCLMLGIKNYYPGKPLPDIVGNFTSRYIWRPLPEGVYEALKKKNPKTKTGSRKYKHHQFCTNEAKRLLQEQIKTTTMLIKASGHRFKEFKKMFARISKDQEIAAIQKAEITLADQIRFDF